MEKIKVVVKTNSKENKIEKIDDYFKVYLKARPVEGEANLELVKFLSKYFKKRARIISGLRSKEKLINLKA